MTDLTSILTHLLAAYAGGCVATGIAIYSMSGHTFWEKTRATLKWPHKLLAAIQDKEHD